MPNFSIQFKNSDYFYQIKIEKHTLILPGDFPWSIHLPRLSLSGDEHILGYKLNSQNDINLQQKNEIKRFFQNNCQFNSDNDKQQFMSDFDQIFQSLNHYANRKKKLYKAIFLGSEGIILLAISAFLIVSLVLLYNDWQSAIPFLDQFVASLKKESARLINLVITMPSVVTLLLSLSFCGLSIVHFLDFTDTSSPKNTAININDATLTTDCMTSTAEDNDIELTNEAENYELHLFNYQTSNKKTILPTKSEIKNQLQETEDEKDLAKEKTDTNQSNF